MDTDRPADGQKYPGLHRHQSLEQWYPPDLKEEVRVEVTPGEERLLTYKPLLRGQDCAWESAFHCFPMAFLFTDVRTHVAQMADYALRCFFLSFSGM